MKKVSLVKAFSSLALHLLALMLASCVGSSADPHEDHRHKWSDWTVVESPTCVSEGRSEQICSCGTKNTKMIRVIPHSEGEWVTDKEATASESGLKHQICSVCGTDLEHKTIPVLSESFLPYIADENQDELRPYYQLANCRNLKGNPVVVLIYIDDDESKWTEQEELTFTNEQVYPALKWLENNAKSRDVELNFSVEIYSTHLSGYEIKYEGTVNPDLDNGGSTKDVLDKAAEDIGYRTNWGLYTYYKAKYPDNDIIFLNILNKSGRSYTRRFISAGRYTFSEHSVIFADRLNESPITRSYGSRASSVANHILRLFGADDLYTTTAREAIAEQKYPNDIMLWTYINISGNTLGDYTTFAIGWTDEVPDVCLDPKWW